jgi:cyanophycinase
MAVKGKLVVIGGSVNKGIFPENSTDLQKLSFLERGILKRMSVEALKNDLSRFEIITTASHIPEEIGRDYTTAFSRLNIKNIGVMDIKTREDANSSEYIDRLKNADVVLFTGGDQLRLTPIFGGTAFHRILLSKYENEHFIIAGTSAGAAASSNNMIYEGSSHEALFKGEVKITGGLGFINNVIIDTHFVQRGRIGRLLYACASNPVNLGIGLGEDAGLLIKNGTDMEAIGSGLVVLVDATTMKDTNISDVSLGALVSVENLTVHVMSLGDHYDLTQRKLKIHHPPPLITE